MKHPFPPRPEGLRTGLAKPRLFTPGPTLGLPEARRAALVAEWHHRTPSFQALFGEVQERLGRLMGTSGPVYLLTSSGSGAMEAAAANLVGRGEEALVVDAGKFGRRWVQILEALGAVPRLIEVPWGGSASPDDVRAALDAYPGVRALFVQATETSTGAAHDLRALAEVVREADDCLLVADAISWLGAGPTEADAWGVDVVVGGSQKALMVGPGLAWLGLGPRASERLAQTDGLPSFYFDLKRQARQSEGRSGFTPGIDAVAAVGAALQWVQEEVGQERFIMNAARQGTAFRAALGPLDLELFPQHPSPALSAVRLPGGVDGAALIRTLEAAYGVKVAGGQGELAGRLIRVAHMGYYDLLDTLGCVAALERALMDIGRPVELGAGLAAAQKAARAFDGEHGAYEPDGGERT